MRAKNANTVGELASMRKLMRQSGVSIDTGNFQFKTVRSQDKPKLARPLSYEDYAAEVFGYRAQPHHKTWIEAILNCVEGRSVKPNLLIIAPPGTAKSSYISHAFPAWWLAEHPDKLILEFTASDKQAHKFHNVVRDVIEKSVSHRSHYPKGVPDYSRGWSYDGLYLDTTPPGNPAYMCVGFSTNVLGSRADLIILDDPLTEDESRSVVTMEAAKDYLTRTIKSRLKPDSGHIIAIMTRWGLTDMAQFLIDRGDFEVIVMPALTLVEEVPSEEFDVAQWSNDASKWRSIWPDYFTVNHYLDIWKHDGTATFGCVYQCDPSALGGDIFHKFSDIPAGVDFEHLHYVIYADLAFSEKTAADFTAIVVDAYDPRPPGTHYIRQVFKAQLTEAGVEDIMVELINRWKPTVWGIEDNNFKTKDITALALNITKRTRRPGYPIKVDSDKILRARLPAARAESGFLYVDRKADWFPAFELECRTFPNATHDDQVDGLSGVVALAEERIALSRGTTTYSIGHPAPPVGGLANEARRGVFGDR